VFSWRTALALALRDVPIQPLIGELWPVFEQMADQVAERLMATVADGALSVPGLGLAAPVAAPVQPLARSSESIG
jgi:hypothetical protein